MEAANIKRDPVEEDDIIGKFAAADIIDPKTKELVIRSTRRSRKMILKRSSSKKVKSFEVLFIDNLNVSSSLRDTLETDKANTKDEALLEIYRKLRPGDPPTTNLLKPLSTICFSAPSATIFRRSEGSR